MSVMTDIALGSGILFTYPEIATIAGVQGLVIYALSSSLPLLVFAFLGPVIRRRCPDGFVLTEWARQRYGAPAASLLSFFTLVTLFLYMVAELAALHQIVVALTGMNGLPAVIVECVVTTIYTSLGGFRISFITDNIQGAAVIGLLILTVVTASVEIHINTDFIAASRLTEASLLGWQLLYILPVAVLTNDFFISGFWMRTFASRSDTDLRVGVSIAVVFVTIILVFVGVTGLLAVWSQALPADGSVPGSLALFLLLQQLPSWVVGIVLILVVALSTAAFDSFQSAMVSTGSNDIFRNRLNLWWLRAAVVLVIVPVVVLALKSPDILQVYLISDLVSASIVPVLCIGLVDRFYLWTGIEVIVGALGGILTIFIFGTIYFGNAHKGANLLLLEGGLYADDWSVFGGWAPAGVLTIGAFVAAPVGGLLWGLGALIVRLVVCWVWAMLHKQPFTALQRPPSNIPRPQYVNPGPRFVLRPNGPVLPGHFSGPQYVTHSSISSPQPVSGPDPQYVTQSSISTSQPVSGPDPQYVTEPKSSKITIRGVAQRIKAKVHDP